MNKFFIKSREAIRTQGLLPQFVFGLSSDSAELVQFCAKAIYMVGLNSVKTNYIFNTSINSM